MKKQLALVILCCLFFSGITTAQRTKKIFLDVQDSLISRRSFKKKLEKARGNILDVLITDTDTLQIHKLFWREHQGILNSIALEQLRYYLESLSGKKLPQNNFIVVNYYPGKDKCNQGGYAEFRLGMMNGYEKALDILGNVSQFYIHKKEASKPFETKINRSFPDETNLFKNVFFPYHFPCDSFVVIHPDGRYIKYYGEYHLQTVVDILQADWELDFFWE